MGRGAFHPRSTVRCPATHGQTMPTNVERIRPTQTITRACKVGLHACLEKHRSLAASTPAGNFHARCVSLTHGSSNLAQSAHKTATTHLARFLLLYENKEPNHYGNHPSGAQSSHDSDRFHLRRLPRHSSPVPSRRARLVPAMGCQLLQLPTWWDQCSTIALFRIRSRRGACLRPVPFQFIYLRRLQYHVYTSFSPGSTWGRGRRKQRRHRSNTLQLRLQRPLAGTVSNQRHLLSLASRDQEQLLLSAPHTSIHPAALLDSWPNYPQPHRQQFPPLHA